MKGSSLITALCCGFIFTAPVMAATGGSWVTLHPKPLSGVLTNPGMGVEDFQGNVLPESEYPIAGIDYYRFYWNELEPKEGQYNYALIDKAIQLAQQANPPQTVSLRFMALADPSDGTKIPQWLIDKGVKGIWVDNHHTFVPDFADPMFIRYVRQLLNAFGQRYNGNANIASVDIGMVGSWGEWHTSNYPELPPLETQYSDSLLKRYVNMMFTAFPSTPKVMLINDSSMMAYATKKGAGWRADCWGDWGVFSSDWSHMHNAYPEAIERASVLNPDFSHAWEKAPVRLETCYTMSNWEKVQHYSRAQVEQSLQWAVDHHASSLNLKSSPIPEQYRDLLDAALVKLGYRLRLNSIAYPSELTQGGTLTLKTDWVNEGVAPPYHSYTLSYRLFDVQGKTAVQWSMTTPITKWLPGEYEFTRSLTLPANLLGHYQLEVAFLNEKNRPTINLAMEGRKPDGWYVLGDVLVNGL